MEVYKVLNNILLSNIDLKYSGHKDSIQTFGKGAYFTGSIEYSNKYSMENIFAVRLTCLLSGSNNIYTIDKDNLPEMENIAYSDDEVFIKEKKEFISIHKLSDTLNDADYINIDNESDIYIIPENSKANLDLINCEIIVYSNLLEKELKDFGIDKRNIKKEEYDIVDSILEKYIK